jgi:hypothetical protein
MKISWFSCGITSAVACKIALRDYEDVELYYIAGMLVHPDNERFISDCEKWYGQKINIVENWKYKNHFEVFKKQNYINSPYGAPCTKILKKDVRTKLEKELNPENQIFGFEFSKKEINRAVRFSEQYPDSNPLYPLIENRLNKNECAGILQNAGIDIPAMYKLGYNNNNCIGCVKGGKYYWNQIRKDFPDVFNEMMNIENSIGASAMKTPLKDLKETEGNKNEEVQFECGLFCEIEFADLISDKTLKILNNKIVN